MTENITKQQKSQTHPGSNTQSIIARQHKVNKNERKNPQRLIYCQKDIPYEQTEPHGKRICRKQCREYKSPQKSNRDVRERSFLQGVSLFCIA